MNTIDKVTLALIICTLSTMLWLGGVSLYRRLRFWFDGIRYANQHSTGVLVLNRMILIDTETSEYFSIHRAVRGFRLVLISWILRF